MPNFEQVFTETFDGFDIALSVTPEDMPPRDCFDVDDVEEIIDIDEFMEDPFDCELFFFNAEEQELPLVHLVTQWVTERFLAVIANDGEGQVGEPQVDEMELEVMQDDFVAVIQNEDEEDDDDNLGEPAHLSPHISGVEGNCAAARHQVERPNLHLKNHDFLLRVEIERNALALLRTTDLK